MAMYKLYRGFSMIELMIALAILGILVAISYPAYLGTVRKTNRAEAKTELFDYAQRLQRCYTAFGKFNDSTNCMAYRQLVATTAPRSRGNQFYEIKFAGSPSVLDATHYTLVATAIALPQTKDTKDGCNELKLDQNGKKEPAECW